MSHYIDHSKGKAAFLSYKKQAWHSLGKVIDTRPTSIKDMAQQAGLDYEVIKMPNIHLMADGTKITSEESFFTYRTDVNKIMGANVGKNYTILQNSEAFGVLESLINNKKIEFETAGALRDGRWSFVCFKFTDPIEIGKGDITESYVSIWNTFDGSKALTAFITPIRIVCNNTLHAALKQAKRKISIRHTNSINARLQEGLRIITTFENTAQKFKEAGNHLLTQSWRERKYFDYITNIFCTPDEIRGLNSGKHPMEVLSTRKTNIIKDVLAYSDSGVGQREAIPGTAWWAYNSVTGYLNNAKTYSSEEARSESLLFGGAEKTALKAFDLAINDNKITPLGLTLN